MSRIAQAMQCLLHNDIRLVLRELVAEKWRNARNYGFALTFFIGLHLFVLVNLIGAKEPPSLATQTGIWLLAAAIMALASLRQSLRLFSKSSDLDLLMSAPVPTTAILAARLLATAAMAGGASAIVLLPAINGVLLVHGRHFAAAYLVWPLLALICSALAYAVVGTVASRTGSIRSLQRAEAYIAIALTVGFFSLELRPFLPSFLEAQINGVIRLLLTLPFIHVPAYAGTGSLLSIASLTALALGGTIAVSRLLPFLNFGRQAEGVSQSPAATRPRDFFFAPHPWQAILRKELRLIARNPNMLARTLPLALYGFLLCFFAARAIKSSMAEVLAVYLTFVAIAAGAQIARIISTTDEAGQLIEQSPFSAQYARLLRAFASQVYPLAGAMGVALAVAALGRPLLAATALFAAAVCGLGASWIDGAAVRSDNRPGSMEVQRDPESITLPRILSAVAFVLFGPVSVGLVASGLPQIGFALLSLSTACCVLVCSLPQRQVV